MKELLFFCMSHSSHCVNGVLLVVASKPSLSTEGYLLVVVVLSGLDNWNDRWPSAASLSKERKR